jgi:hypothetical protein
MRLCQLAFRVSWMAARLIGLAERLTAASQLFMATARRTACLSAHPFQPLKKKRVGDRSLQTCHP